MATSATRLQTGVFLAALGAGLVTLAAPVPAHACRCAVPTSHLEAVLAHDIAFRGRVVRIESDPSASAQRVTFRVARRYKLDPMRLVTVRAHPTWRCPTPQFQRRRLFDVYATRDTDGAWLVSDCNPSVPILGRRHAYAPRPLAEAAPRRLATHLAERELARQDVRGGDGRPLATTAVQPDAWGQILRRRGGWVLRLSRMRPPAGLWAEVSFRRDGSEPVVRMSYSSR